MPRFSRRRIPDEWRLLALNQASHIHREYAVVEEIVGEALRNLTVNSAQQRKRLFAHPQKPTRIFLNDIHILQYLVFYSSEVREKAHEAYALPDSIREWDMIARYLALIVRKVLKRNSLYGVTGLCRFIYNYTLSEVREIHGTLVDEPDNLKTDDDFRINKKKMRDMIHERFSRYLRIEESRHGQEKHFELRNTQDDSSLLQLIEKTLDAFTPWLTECLCAEFGQPEDWRSDGPLDEEPVSEIRRLHILIHPRCLQKVTDHLRFDLPNTRLAIPQFFSKERPMENGTGGPADPPGGGGTDGGGNNGGDDSNSTPFRDQRLEVLGEILTEQAKNLDRFKPEGVLTIKIDHKNVAALDLDVTKRVEFIVNDEQAEVIEVVAEDGLALGVCLIDQEVWRSNGGTHSYVVRLNYATRVRFLLRRVANDTGNRHLVVTVTCREMIIERLSLLLRQSLRNLRLKWRRTLKGILPSLSALPPFSPTIAIKRLSFLWLIPVLIIAAAVGLLVLDSSSPKSKREIDAAFVPRHTVTIWSANPAPPDPVRTHIPTLDGGGALREKASRITKRIRLRGPQAYGSTIPQHGGCPIG